jgi:hypothetical protein
MPVTINGDGSITGLTAGGLPAVAVTPADGSITSAKLANGAATQDKRTYAAGEVVQVAYGFLQGNTTNTQNLQSSSYTDVNFEASITPKFSDSKIIINIVTQWQLYRQNKETAYSLQLLKAGSQLHEWDSNWYYEADTSVESRILLKGMTPNYFVDTSGGTSSITYEAKYKVGHGSSSNNKLDFNASGGCSTMTLTEIKV